MLEQLTAKQLAEWEAYSNIDPVGEWRNDFKFSYMASLITNLMIQAYGKKGSKMTKIEDFQLQWDTGVETESKQQSVEEMKNILLGLAASQNKKTEQSPPVKRRKV